VFFKEAKKIRTAILWRLKMLKILKNRKAQNTAEYAILIALVVGAIIAMQSYVQRGLQARTRGTTLYMTNEMVTAMKAVDSSAVISGVNQYNPYYTDSVQETTRNFEEGTEASPNFVGVRSNTNKTRAASDNPNAPTVGYDKTAYNEDMGKVGQD
jgi:Flp pilus assembly pilin Flp